MSTIDVIHRLQQLADTAQAISGKPCPGFMFSGFLELLEEQDWLV